MNNKEFNAVILARVSSKAQEDEGYSLDSQEKLLVNYCQSKQLIVTKTFKIAETASKEQSRKIFHELLCHIDKNDVYHLIIEKTDRFTRNFRDAVAIDDWLEKDPKRRLHAVKENILLHKEAKSDVKFMWNIHVSVAKKYADNLREEAMKGWAEKLAQGWLPAPPPPGYKTVVENGKKIHVPDKRIAPLMKQVFETYLNPNYSLLAIAGEMKLLGITTRKGRYYHKSQVQNILSNPFYIGINRFDGKEYPGKQEPIISKELFDKVQQKMHGKRPIKFRKHNPTFKNLINCGNCGGLVTWQLQKGRYYGTCQRRNMVCRGRKLLREDKLEEKLISMLADLVSPSEDVINWVVTAMQTKHKTDIEDNSRIAISIKTQIERIERMDNNLYDDKLAGVIDARRYEQKHAELTAEKIHLEKRLGQIDETLGLLLEKKLALFKLSQRAAQIYPTKSPEQKRLIITKLFSSLVLEGEHVSVKYTNFARAIAQNVQKTRKLVGGTL